MVLMLPGGGDELQGIKKGILELADALVINKADGDSEQMAQLSRTHYTSAMNLLRHTTFWTPRVMTCSALKLINIDAIWGMIIDYYFPGAEGRCLSGQAGPAEPRLDASPGQRNVVAEVVDQPPGQGAVARAGKRGRESVDHCLCGSSTHHRYAVAGRSAHAIPAA